jgi:UDP-glucose 4-epimerase
MLDAGFAEIRVFSRDELKQDDMRRFFGHPALRFYLGDVRDGASVEGVMHGADFVFHAAALKQVPTCEFFPLEAIRTNAIGTDNVLTAAVANGVSRVVVLSTDKAAYPINAMGMTKGLSEKLVVAKAGQAADRGTVVCCTRYGNILASRGSVVPLFVKQAVDGKPLTITNPDMTRFMMTIEDAVNLVEFAFHHADAGDLFVHQAPAASIGDLAQSVQGVLGRDVGVKYIGVRHGEKLFETLLTSEEMARSEDMGKYYRVRRDGRDLNYDSFFTEGESRVAELHDYHSHNTRRLGIDEVSDMLRTLPVVKSAMMGS